MITYNSSSQALQDLFALTVCGEQGYWLEIGAGHPIKANNTYLLEQQGWQGYSLELTDVTAAWQGQRQTVPVITDALEFDYYDLPRHDWDYLSIDIEPAAHTYHCLRRIIQAGHRFRAVTFEHDLYADPDNQHIQKAALEFLESYGYRRYIKNVSRVDRPEIVFEDWYVGPGDLRPETDYKSWVESVKQYRSHHLRDWVVIQD